ncbi:NAD(P)/FAD-dependent oxidoreductase [Pontibaca salina]|uniref:FAD-dependent oxidoreductase n=1 Tax=Pontibaca salina TaxID=2795731 RepID=A0A934M4G4_9RHOB|nr:FAD-dependent oxidoreductase [Pontibaca salina]MBI6630884.1 FAD-dependent oxidoreductase [Pontibaca salina]
MTTRLVVVGGGYVGSEVSRRLDALMDVTLIEPREAFVHTPAMIRSLVDGDLLDAAIFPYDRLLSRGRVIRERAAGLRPDGVALASGAFVPGDLILVATGSSYPAPFKPQTDDIADFRASQNAIRTRVSQAQTIVIVGAGPVGVELAGEIASAHPAISVTLVSEQDHLLPGHPPRLGRMLRRKLQSLGVELIVNRRAVKIPGEGAAEKASVTLDNGAELAADLVLSATGAQGRSDLLASLPGVKINRGRVVTDSWLRPCNWSNLFVGGDAADVGEAMTIVATMRQVPFLVRTLRAAAAGKPVARRRPYRPWTNAPILVPLGRKIGGSYLPVPRQIGPLGVTGNFLTRQLKGNDLFIPKYRKAFGYPTGSNLSDD